MPRVLPGWIDSTLLTPSHQLQRTHPISHWRSNFCMKKLHHTIVLSYCPLAGPNSPFTWPYFTLHLTLFLSSFPTLRDDLCLDLLVFLRNLIPCDKDNLADPYVRIYLLPDRSNKKKTKLVKNSLSPIFDETYVASSFLALFLFRGSP